MRIAIIGTGNVGSALGAGWAAHGHTITFGVRNPGEPKYIDFVEAMPNRVRVETIADAVSDAEVIALASPWPTVPEVLASGGDWSGKIVIDCNNPLNPDLKSLSIGHTISAGEMIARWVKHAHVVKCFNTIGADRMREPTIDGKAITMPYCGNDDAAKRIVHQLAKEIGFEPFDIGGIEMSRLLEPLAMMWIYLAVHRGWGTNFALQWLREGGVVNP